MTSSINLTLDSTQFKKLLLYSTSHPDPEMQMLNKILCDKLERMIEHEIYSRYKTGATPEQREQARQEYLNRRGIHIDWRW